MFTPISGGWDHRLQSFQWAAPRPRRGRRLRECNVTYNNKTSNPHSCGFPVMKKLWNAGSWCFSTFYSSTLISQIVRLILWVIFFFSPRISINKTTKISFKKQGSSIKLLPCEICRGGIYQKPPSWFRYFCHIHEEYFPVSLKSIWGKNTKIKHFQDILPSKRRPTIRPDEVFLRPTESRGDGERCREGPCFKDVSQPVMKEARNEVKRLCCYLHSTKGMSCRGSWGPGDSGFERLTSIWSDGDTFEMEIPPANQGLFTLMKNLVAWCRN